MAIVYIFITNELKSVSIVIINKSILTGEINIQHRLNIQSISTKIITVNGLSYHQNGDNMFTMTVGKQTTRRYKLQWHDFNGKRYFVKKTRILHSVSLQNVKNKGVMLFGTIPDYIVRI